METHLEDESSTSLGTNFEEEVQRSFKGETSEEDLESIFLGDRSEEDEESTVKGDSNEVVEPNLPDDIEDLNIRLQEQYAKEVEFEATIRALQGNWKNNTLRRNKWRRPSVAV